MAVLILDALGMTTTVVLSLSYRQESSAKIYCELLARCTTIPYRYCRTPGLNKQKVRGSYSTREVDSLLPGSTALLSTGRVERVVVVL